MALARHGFICSPWSGLPKACFSSGMLLHRHNMRKLRARLLCVLVPFLSETWQVHIRVVWSMCLHTAKPSNPNFKSTKSDKVVTTKVQCHKAESGLSNARVKNSRNPQCFNHHNQFWACRDPPAPPPSPAAAAAQWPGTARRGCCLGVWAVGATSPMLQEPLKKLQRLPTNCQSPHAMLSKSSEVTSRKMRFTYQKPSRVRIKTREPCFVCRRQKHLTMRDEAVQMAISILTNTHHSATLGNGTADTTLPTTLCQCLAGYSHSTLKLSHQAPQRLNKCFG